MLNMLMLFTLPLIVFHLQGRKDVTVHVTDLNDNAPEFSPPLVTAILTEGNSTTNKFVIRVNATDKDEGDNKLITYSITGGNLGDVFQIDRDTVRCIMKMILNRKIFYATHLKQRNRQTNRQRKTCSYGNVHTSFLIFIEVYILLV